MFFRIPGFHIIKHISFTVIFYGTFSLDEINSQLKELAQKENIEIEFLQSNHEGEIVEAIGCAKDNFDALLINPAAYTHTSVAIRENAD